MKKLIVYDASCPMCRLYTKGMVAADGSGCLARVSNADLPPAVLSQIDAQRARHEIPLVDLDGGETLYGVDTWAYAFGHRSPTIARLLSLAWLRALLQTVYAFISYNRRIIITSAPGRWQLLDLQPTFRLRYRLTFVVLIFGLVGALPYAAGRSFAWPVAGLLVGQLALVGLYLGFSRRFNTLETLLDYAGHLGMSLLVGGVVVVLALAANWPAGVLMGGTLAIGQHFIRVYRLGLNPWLSVSFTGLCLLLLPL